MSTADAEVVAYAVGFAFLGVVLYTALVMAAWPYARVRFPFFLLLFVAIFFPPLFVFLALYLLTAACVFPPTPVLVAVPVRPAALPGRPVVATGHGALRGSSRV